MNILFSVKNDIYSVLSEIWKIVREEMNLLYCSGIHKENSVWSSNIVNLFFWRSKVIESHGVIPRKIHDVRNHWRIQSCFQSTKRSGLRTTIIPKRKFSVITHVIILVLTFCLYLDQAVSLFRSCFVFLTLFISYLLLFNVRWTVLV